MMDGYGHMSSGGWLGMALLLALWTLAVVVTTSWVVAARHASQHKGRHAHDA